MGVSCNVVGIICPPDLNRVNVSVKFCPHGSDGPLLQSLVQIQLRPTVLVVNLSLIVTIVDKQICLQKAILTLHSAYAATLREIGKYPKLLRNYDFEDLGGSREHSQKILPETASCLNNYSTNTPGSNFGVLFAKIWTQKRAPAEGRRRPLLGAAEAAPILCLLNN